MDLFKDVDPFIVSWFLIPGLIFLARICDVSLGTLRIVFISKGNRTMAPLLGFFEVLIWLVAITQVMKNLSNVACYIAWAGGFATGNFIGLWLEERLAMGQVVIRFITAKPADEVVEKMREIGYRVTQVDAHGSRGKVSLLFMVVKRKALDEIIQMITQFNPKAFYSIEDVRTVSEYEGFDQPTGKSLLARMFKGVAGK